MWRPVITARILVLVRFSIELLARDRAQAIMIPFLTIQRFSILALVTIGLFHFGETKNPVQFCKQDVRKGVDFCVGFFSLLNISSSGADFYITIETNRYDSSSTGWTAFGLGDRMEGALMFVTYGDPSNGPLITSVRTANGHHPPTTDLSIESQDPSVPDVRVINDKFGPYINTAGERPVEPTHTDRKHIICYGCDHWAGTAIDGHSQAQPWIYGYNDKQDFNGDFSTDAHIDMHAFGGGFGRFWSNVEKSRMFAPIFGRINPLYLNFHTSEVKPAVADQPQEEAPASTTPEDEAQEEDTSEKTDDSSETENPDAPKTPAVPPPGAPIASSPEDSDVEQPARTWRSKSLRDWMWHLHGLIMSLAFLALYPLGTILIRSGDARAFNFHWTTQAFASVLVMLGSVIGFTQSKGISVTHQYLGFAVLGSIGMQVLLGWRHHVGFLKTKTKSWFSPGHIWLGRVVLGAGYVNLVLGLRLRQYSRATMLGMVLAIAAEVAFLFFMIGRLKRSQREEGRRTGRNTDAQLEEAEEYFQLVGDDEDEYGWSDDEQSEEATLAKREKAKKLAKLDNV